MKGKWSEKIINKIAAALMTLLVIILTAMVISRSLASPEKLMEKMAACVEQGNYKGAVTVYRESFVRKYRIEKMNTIERSMKALYYFADYMDYNITAQPEKLFTTDELQEKREKLRDWEEWLGEHFSEKLAAMDTRLNTYLELTEKINDYYKEVFRGAEMIKEFYQTAIITMNEVERGGEASGDLVIIKRDMEEKWKKHKSNRDRSLYDLQDYNINLIRYYYQLPKGVEIQQFYRCADVFINDFSHWSTGKTKDFMESSAYGTLEERIKEMEEYKEEFEKGSEEFTEINLKIKSMLAKKYQEGLKPFLLSFCS